MQPNFRQCLTLLLVNLVNCDAVDGDPETAFAGEGWVHQERLNLDVIFYLLIFVFPSYLKSPFLLFATIDIVKNGHMLPTGQKYALPIVTG